MVTEEFLKSLFNLYSNPFFKKGFSDFFLKVQQEGIEAAKKFWDISPMRQSLFPNTSEIFEKMIDFYRNLGFVPFTTYEELMKENKQLKRENEQLEKENQFLKDTIQDLNQRVFTEGGKSKDETSLVLDKSLSNKEADHGKGI